MAAIKHIIFKGKPRTGKSLFANTIFDRAKTLWITAYKIKNFDPFLFDVRRSVWDYEYVVIDDPSRKFNIDSFINTIFADELVIERRGRDSIKVKMPKFIFLIDSETITIPEDESFQRRFKIIDFDKNTIADLTKLINEEKIIINNHR